MVVDDNVSKMFIRKRIMIIYERSPACLSDHNLNLFKFVEFLFDNKHYVLINSATKEKKIKNVIFVYEMK